MELQVRNRKIRNEHKKGATFVSLSKKFNISSERIRQICLDTEDKAALAADMLSKYKHFLITKDDYGTLLNQIASLSKPDRKKETVLRRRELIRYLHDKLDLSFFKIALLLRRHHTSVSNLYIYEK